MWVWLDTLYQVCTYTCIYVEDVLYVCIVLGFRVQNFLTQHERDLLRSIANREILVMSIAIVSE